ncbi:hypothetical protein ACP70R_042278 [Stipagrostis hirtigluma subsp. patula]
MLAHVAVPLADRRRASAVRRFPPGCGRHHNAAAGRPRVALPSSTADLPLLNSSARAAAKTASPTPRRTLPSATSSGTERPDRSVGNGRNAAAAAAAAVAARRVSAVRRYPTGCGRGVAVSKPLALAGEGGAGATKPTAVVCNGEAKARACDKEAVLLDRALDHGESDSNGGVKNGGGGDAGAREEGGGKPWVVTGLMAAPFLPWAKYGRRSQRLKLL